METCRSQPFSGRLCPDRVNMARAAPGVIGSRYVFLFAVVADQLSILGTLLLGLPYNTS